MNRSPPNFSSKTNLNFFQAAKQKVHIFINLGWKAYSSYCKPIKFIPSSLIKVRSVLSRPPSVEEVVKELHDGSVSFPMVQGCSVKGALHDRPEYRMVEVGQGGPL